MKAGFTYHMELEPILVDLESDGKISEDLREQCLTIRSEHTYQLNFTGTEGRDAVMYLPNGDPGYPAETGEIEFEEDAADLAFHPMAILVARLPLRFIEHQGAKLIMIHKAIEDHLNSYMEGEGGDRAITIASDWKYTRDCDDADHKMDEQKDRQMEEDVWYDKHHDK